jgi:hypothetical protein
MYGSLSMCVINIQFFQLYWEPEDNDIGLKHAAHIRGVSKSSRNILIKANYVLPGSYSAPSPSK